MDYIVLTENEQHDLILQTLLAQERDHFLHQLNLDRYNDLLDNQLSGDMPLRGRVAQLKAETEERLTEVSAIIAAVIKQLPSQDKVEASIARVRVAEARSLGIPEIDPAKA